MTKASPSIGLSLERLRAGRAGLVERAARELSPDRVLRSFLWFFSIKLFCTFNLIAVWAGHHGAWLRLLAAACSLAMLSPKTANPGALGWLGLMTAHAVFTWPYTLNHFFLELAFLLVLSVHPKAGRDPETSREVLAVLCIVMVSVWFFSGVQKVAQGHYLNGESFALELLGASSFLGVALRSGLAFVEQLLGVKASFESASSSPAVIALSGVAKAYCLLLSWFVPAAECVLALGVFISRKREWVLGAMMLGQLGIACVSKEYDFALTGLAALGLGWRRWVDVRHGVLALAAVLLSLGASQ